VYSSVDLRHAGFKLAPVDTNLFPAGFNNLSPMARGHAVRALRDLFAEQYPNARRILLIPENHTRNLHYLENLSVLLGIIESAGMEVQLGSLIAQSGKPVELAAPSGRALAQYPLRRKGDTLALENGFVPELVLMNNDMTAGSPDILAGLSQPVLPPVS